MADADDTLAPIPWNRRNPFGPDKTFFGRPPKDEHMIETERVVYVQHIDPDHVDDYLEAHENVPEAVTDAMERGGVERFDLFVEGTVAVCVMDVEDLDAYEATIDGNEGVEAWERRVGEFKRSGVDPDAPSGEQLPYATRIWSFESE